MKIIISIIMCLLLSSCVPALIGSVAYKSSKTKQQRQEFTNNLQTTNLEREKAGLEPLDWCEEVYKFDSKWAQSQPKCVEQLNIRSLKKNSKK